MTTVPPVAGLRAPVEVEPAVPERSAADEAMRRLLRVDDAGVVLGEAELRSAFSRSMVVSAVRCILTYLVIPFVAPVVGVASGVGPLIGLPVGVLAIVFNVKSMRRFWRADHRWRWAYTAVGTTVIAMLVVLIGLDLVDLLS